MKENFPNLVKEIDMQVQEAQRIPDKIVAKRAIPKHIIIEMSKVKNKEQQEKKKLVTYKGVPIRLSTIFSKEKFQARRDWQETFKVMKSRDLWPRWFTQQSYHLECKGR